LGEDVKGRVGDSSEDAHRYAHPSQGSQHFRKRNDISLDTNHHTVPLTIVLLYLGDPNEREAGSAERHGSSLVRVFPEQSTVHQELPKGSLVFRREKQRST